MAVESAGFLLSTVTETSKTTRRATSTYAALFNRGKGGIVNRINQQTAGSLATTGDFAVTAASTAFVAVAGGEIWVPGTDNATDQGMYCLYNSASVSLGITATSTNPRKDLIVAQVLDNDYGDGADQCKVAVIQGTAAPSPVDPTVPANSTVLARVTIPASTSNITNAMITDLRPVLYSPLQFPIQPTNIVSGSVPTLPTQVLVQTGNDVVTPNGSGVATITFPKPFPNGVFVVIPCNGDIGAAKSMVSIVLSSVTTSTFQVGATIGSTPTTTGNVRVNWIAFGF